MHKAVQAHEVLLELVQCYTHVTLPIYVASSEYHFILIQKWTHCYQIMPVIWHHIRTKFWLPGPYYPPDMHPSIFFSSQILPTCNTQYYNLRNKSHMRKNKCPLCSYMEHTNLSRQLRRNVLLVYSNGSTANTSTQPVPRLVSWKLVSLSSNKNLTKHRRVRK